MKRRSCSSLSRSANAVSSDSLRAMTASSIRFRAATREERSVSLADLSCAVRSMTCSSRVSFNSWCAICAFFCSVMSRAAAKTPIVFPCSSQYTDAL